MGAFDSMIGTSVDNPITLSVFHADDELLFFNPPHPSSKGILTESGTFILTEDMSFILTE